MAAVAVDSKAGSFGAGRDFATGYVSPLSYKHPPRISSRLGSQGKLTVLTSTKSAGHVSSAGGSLVSPRPNKQTSSRAELPNIDTNMTSYSTTSTIPTTTSRSESRIAKLHKRASSGSSLPTTPSPLATTSHSQLTTPYTTYEQSHASTPPARSSPSFKSRPYIRKFSSAKDDESQGKLDLSKSISETTYFPGLGIQDYGARSASDVTFSHTTRRAAHARTTSGGSQTSVASRSFTPTQPFMHPMRQTPYTPSGQSYASSMNDDEAHESSDIVTDDDILVGQNFRARRSVSVSSTPQIQPTPLSQSHTAADLGYVPKFNTSQTNLSIKSGRSAKSSKSKLGRPRRDTERSDHRAPSIRTSTDKAFSFVSRRSDPDPQTRDERIREKRRQFNEKEASKERKREREELKRRETEEMKEEKQRRKSEASQTERPKISQSGGKITGIRKTRRNTEKRGEELRSRSYDEVRPAQLTALPREDGTSEKTRGPQRDSKDSSGTWPRFSTWMQTRLLSCGGKG